jgi:WD40 repeat protein
MTLLNVLSGEIEKQWSNPTGPVRGVSSGGGMLPITLSRDGKWLVARGAGKDNALIYNLVSKEFVRRLPIEMGYIAQFTNDNSTVVLSTQNGLEWWDVAAEAPKRTRLLSGVPSVRGNAEWALSPDGNQVAFGSESVSNPGVSIWSVPAQKEVVKLYLLGGTSQNPKPDWIALTPEGFYNATPRGEQRLRWRTAQAFLPLTKSRMRFKSPAKVAAALRGR